MTDHTALADEIERDIANLELFLAPHDLTSDDWLLSDLLEPDDNLLDIGLLRRCLEALRAKAVQQ